MEFGEIVKECAGRLGVSQGLQVMRDGGYRLSVDPSLQLTFERTDEEGIYYLYSALGLLPERKGERSALLEAMMEGNLFGRGTGKASLGYDSGSGLLLLFQRFDEASTSCDDLYLQLVRFLGFHRYWRAAIEEARDGSLVGVHRLDDPEIGIKKRSDQIIFPI